MENLLSIGNVAKIFNISVSSLRHYENIGILVPEYVDTETGYRYYSERQLEVINTIKYLRALDMPLSEISDFINNRDIDIIEEKLLQQKINVIEKQRRLKKIERKIDNRISQIKDARNSLLDEIQLVTIPHSRIVWVKDKLTINNFLDMEEPINRFRKLDNDGVIFLGKIGLCIEKEHLISGEYSRYDGIFLLLDDEDDYNSEIIDIEATRCVRIRYCGSHKEAPEYYKKLIDYIADNNMEISGFAREITLIDYGITNDTDKFVTEISIPVN